MGLYNGLASHGHAIYQMFPAKVQPSDDVIYQPIKDEIVLLNLQDQQYFGLDDVGSAMWRLLVEHGDIETAASHICAEYNVDMATARYDIQVLVQNLVEARLLKAVKGEVL